MNSYEKRQKLDVLYADIVRKFEFGSKDMGTVFVPGNGALRDNPMVFVGEAPGREEEAACRPFVGPAGKNLSRLLELAGLKREDVYVTNLIKYRPRSISGNNRPPTDKERKAALPYLMDELRILGPQMVVCLGLSAAKALLAQPHLKMADANGTIQFFNGWHVLVTYHPSPLNFADLRKREALRQVFQQMGDLLRSGLQPVSGT